MTERALAAAAKAATEGVSCAVLHMPTLKPFDAEMVCRLASRVSRVVTAENHLRARGLGSAVIETLFEAQIQRPVIRIGLRDRFHDCGSQGFLDCKYGLDTDAIKTAVVDGRWDY
jgi:transketolase